MSIDATIKIEGAIVGLRVYVTETQVDVTPYQVGNKITKRDLPSALAVVGIELAWLLCSWQKIVDQLEGEPEIECPTCGDVYYLKRAQTCPTYSCQKETP